MGKSTNEPIFLKSALKQKIVDRRDFFLSCVSLALFAFGIPHHIGSLFSITPPISLFRNRENWQTVIRDLLKIHLTPANDTIHNSKNLLFTSPHIVNHRRWGFLVPASESGVNYLLSPAGGLILFHPEILAEIDLCIKITLLESSEFYFNLLTPDPRKIPVTYFFKTDSSWNDTHFSNGKINHESRIRCKEKNRGDTTSCAHKSETKFKFERAEKINSILTKEMEADIYENIRDVYLARHRVKFCPFNKVDEYLFKLDKKVEILASLDILTLELVAQFYSDFNSIHPFPNENGRANIKLCAKIFNSHQIELDHKKVESSAWYFCAHQAALGEIGPLSDLFEKCIHKS